MVVVVAAMLTATASRNRLSEMLAGLNVSSDGWQCDHRGRNSAFLSRAPLHDCSANAVWSGTVVQGRSNFGRSVREPECQQVVRYFAVKASAIVLLLAGLVGGHAETH